MLSRHASAALAVLFTLCLTHTAAQAQDTASVATDMASIIDTLTSYADAEGRPLFSISMDQRILDLISREKRSGLTVKKGKHKTLVYRVQVFSSNEQRTAKDQAYEMEKRMLSAFPNISTYVIYQPPFWKVRLGDFRTPEEAQGLRNSVSHAFPQLKGDIYNVTDYLIK